MTPRVSICIATFNKAEALQRTLASIFRQRPRFPFAVIVVDDGSRDRTAAVCARFESLTYRRLREPGAAYRNPSPARNVAYRLARGPIVICQSDEVEHVTPNAIAHLAWLQEQKPNAAIFATVLNVKETAPGVFQPIEIYVGAERPRPLFFLGCCWRKDIFAIGGNDEDFVDPGFDDDWFAMCLGKGLDRQFILSSAVVGWHHDHPRPPETCHPASKALFEEKCRLAEQGLHPWGARTGPWPWVD